MSIQHDAIHAQDKRERNTNLAVTGLTLQRCHKMQI
jgi:hypothetical protein